MRKIYKISLELENEVLETLHNCCDRCNVQDFDVQTFSARAARPLAAAAKYANADFMPLTG